MFYAHEIDQKLLDILEHEMNLKSAQAEGAKEVWMKSKLKFCENNYRFKKGQRITVHYANAMEDYIFEKIDWHWMNNRDPVIFAKRILKSGKISAHPADALESSNGVIKWDTTWVKLSKK